MKTNFKLLAVFLAGLLATSCSNDETEAVNLGNEITFNTSVTRAADITTDNLDKFKAWAIWPKVSQTFIDGVVAQKKINESYFSFERAVFWPNDVNQLNFWAVAPSNTPNVQISSEKKSISAFTPSSTLADQTDLIVAYTEAPRSDGTNVTLKFKHVLSQIVVKAKAGVDKAAETKTVKLKGVWIMNVKSKGDLSMTTEQISENDEEKNIAKFNWNANGDKIFYGREFTKIIDLDHDEASLLDTGDTNSNMLLVPQQLDTWNINDDTDKTANASAGAYIVLLCRVEATHDGKLHDVQSDPSVSQNDEKHTHQMFPYTGTYNESQFGYTCVPINTNWEPGKKYVYTLTFCGQTSGAGIYPPSGDLTGLPKSSSDINYITNMPSGKNIGDPVLDNPISFTVEVDTWDEKWNNGNISMK